MNQNRVLRWCTQDKTKREFVLLLGLRSRYKPSAHGTVAVAAAAIRGHYTRPGPVLPIIATLLFFFDLSLHILVFVSVIGLFPVQHSGPVLSMTSFTYMDKPVCKRSAAISPLDAISTWTWTSTWASIAM